MGDDERTGQRPPNRAWTRWESEVVDTLQVVADRLDETAHCLSRIDRKLDDIQEQLSLIIEKPS